MTRQYTQLVALMNNFDFYKENVDRANNADGSLQRQADTYAESWEAAQKRVQAAWQAIYSDLLDDEFFIKLLNGLEKVLQGVDKFIDSIGGVRGLLTNLGAIATNLFAKNLAEGINKFAFNFKNISAEINNVFPFFKHIETESEKAQKEIYKMGEEIEKAYAKQYGSDEAGKAARSVFDLSRTFNDNKDQMSTDKQQAMQALIKLQEEQMNLLKEEEKKRQDINKEFKTQDELIQQAINKTKEKAHYEVNQKKTEIEQQVQEEMKNNPLSILNSDEIQITDNNGNVDIQKMQDALIGIKAELNDLDPMIDAARVRPLEQALEEYEQLVTKFENLVAKNEKYQKTLSEYKANSKASTTARTMMDSIDEGEPTAENTAVLRQQFKDLISDAQIAGTASAKALIDAFNKPDEELDFTVIKQGLQDLQTEVSTQAGMATDTITDILQNDFGMADEEITKFLGKLDESIQKEIQNSDTRKKIMEKDKALVKEMSDNIPQIDLGKVFAGSLQIISAVSAATNNFISVLDIFADKQMSTGEKIKKLFAMLIPFITSFGMAIRTVSNVVKTEFTQMQLAAGWIGIVLSALSVLVTVLSSIDWDKMFASKAEKGLNKVNEAVEKSKSEFEDLKQLQDSLANDTSSYDSLIDKLNECTKGTQDWRDAMQEVLDKTNELIVKYPELLSKVGAINANGTLNQDVLNSYLDEVNTATQAKNVEILQLQQIQSDKQFDVDKENIFGKADGSAASAYNQFLLNNRDNLQYLDADELKAAINKQKQEYLKDFMDDSEDSDEASDQWDAAVRKDGFFQDGAQLVSNVQNKYNQLDAAQAQKDATDANLTNALALSYGSDQLVKGLSAGAGQLLIKAVNEATDEKADDVVKNIRTRGRAGGNDNYDNMTDDQKAFFDSVLKNQQNADTSSAYRLSKDNLLEGVDDERQVILQKQNEKGEWEDFKIDIDKAEAMYRSQEALAASGKALSEVNANLTKFYDGVEKTFEGRGDEVGNALLNGLTSGNLDELSEDVYELIKDIDFDSDDWTAQLAEKLGIDEETLTGILPEDGQDKFKEAVGAYQEALDSVFDNFTNATKKKLGNGEGQVDTEGLSLSDKKTVAGVLDAAYLNGGEEAQDTVAALLSGLTGDSLAKAANGLNSFDWNNSSLFDLQALLKELNIESEASDAELQALSDSMKQLSEKSISELSDSYAEQAKIVKGLKNGDTIKGEDWEKLDSELQQFFTQAEDGTYRLNDATGVFGKTVDSILSKDFREEMNRLKGSIANKQAYADNFDANNYGDLTALKNGGIYSLMNYQIASSRGGAEGAYNYRQQSTANGQNALNFLIDSEQISTQEANALQDKLNSGNWTQITKALTELQERMNDAATSGEELEDLAQQDQEKYEAMAQAYTSTALASVTSLSELDGTMSQLMQDGFANISGYTEALTNLGLSYENCADEVEKYQEALRSNDEETIAATEDLLRASILIGEAAKTYGIEAETAEIQAEKLRNEYDVSAEIAAKMAIQNQRLNKGVSTLNKNWETWNKTLKESEDTSMDYADTMADLREAVADIVGAVDATDVPLEVLEKHFKDGTIEKAAKGDVDAINKLGMAVAEATVNSWEFQDAMETAVKVGDNDTWSISAEQFDNYKETVITGMQAIHDAVANGTLSAGQDALAAMGEMGEGWVNALNEMAIATEMSVDEMNALLNEAGVQAEVNTTWKEQKVKVPKYKTSIIPLKWTNGVMTEYASQTVQTGVEEVDGGIEVAQINTGSHIGEKPKITYTGVSASSARGGVSKSSTSGSKSSGSQRKAEPERYHEVTKQREDIDSRLKKNNTRQGQAYGVEEVDYIKQEADLIDEQIKNTKRHLEEALGYLEYDKQQLLKGGYGFVIDGANGLISNYEEIYEKYRQMYLSGAIPQEAWDLFQKQAKQYEDTLKIVRDKENEQEELAIKEHEKRLQAITTEINIKIRIDDRDLDTLEFLLSKLEDKEFTGAQNIALLTQEIGKNLSQIQAYQDGVAKVFSEHGITKEEQQKITNGEYSGEDLKKKFNLSNKDIEFLDEARKYVMDGLQEVDEKRKAIYDAMRQDVEDYLENVDRINKRIEFGTKRIQHYQNVIGLVGEKFLGVDYAYMQMLDKSLIASNLGSLEVATKNVDTLKDKLQQARENLLANPDDDLMKKQVQQLEEDLMEAQDTMASTFEQTLQTITDAFDNAIEDAKNAFKDSLNGSNMLDTLADSYDKYLDLRDEYLATYEQEYELSKLNRDLQNKMDNTSNLKAKQQLLDMQRQITALQASGVQMSQYDLEYLQKKFELQQAQMAVEEAKNAKSNVALRRNADGGFSYVYTANQDDVAAAEQNYEDKLNEMQKFNQQYIDDLQNNIYQLEQNCAEDLANIDRQIFNTQELYDAEAQRISDYYQEKLGYYLQQMDNACEHTGTTFKDTFVGQHTPVGSSFEYMANYVEKMGKPGVEGTYLGDMSDGFTEWSANTEAAFNAAGEATDGYAETVNTDINGEGGILDDLDSLELEYDEVRGKFDNAFVDSLDALKNFQKDFNSYISNAVTDAQKFAIELGKVTNAIEQQRKAQIELNNAPKTPTITGGSVGGPGNTGPGTTKGPKTEDKESPKVKGYKILVATNINSTGPQPGALAIKFEGSTAASEAQEWLARMNGIGGITYKMKEFDTGGYTGAWGDPLNQNGKLAMLHEKELVLNREDTTNMLSAVDVVRKLSQTIDLNAMVASNALNLHAAGVLDNNQTLQQNVTITASFEGPTTKETIEMAFSDLINQASQYANRKTNRF